MVFVTNMIRTCKAAITERWVVLTYYWMPFFFFITRSSMYCYKKHDTPLHSRSLLAVKTVVFFWQRDDLVVMADSDLGKHAHSLPVKQEQAWCEA